MKFVECLFQDSRHVGQIGDQIASAADDSFDLLKNRAVDLFFAAVNGKAFRHEKQAPD